MKVLIEGKHRARIKRFSRTDGFFQVEIEEIDDATERTVELEALVRTRHGVFEHYVKLNKRIPPEMLMCVTTIEDPSRLADTIVAQLSNLKLKTSRRSSRSESFQAPREALQLMQGEIEILQVEKTIRSRVKKQMESPQKEYYLNEQMQAIQKELGRERRVQEPRSRRSKKQIQHKKMRKRPPKRPRRSSRSSR